jgi:hypothetical protein
VIQIKKIHFDEELGSLIDKEGKQFGGKRFATISAHSVRSSSRESAQSEALQKLEGIASQRGATAYEVMNLSVDDSRQEYDTHPYSASATAILYK